MEPTYFDFLRDVKDHILQSRYRAARLVNRELLLLYYAVGKRLSEKVADEKWGNKVIEQLSADLQKELPGLRGFSRRNLFNMKAFADEYADLSYLFLDNNQTNTQQDPLVQLTTALMDELPATVFFGISFTHHTTLLTKCQTRQERLFYMIESAKNQWTVEMLDWQVKAKLYQKRGKLPNNFSETMPEKLRDAPLQAFKDEYLLDFINVEADDERVLEKGIVQNIREFILKMGTGFSFVGNQYRLIVDEQVFRGFALLQSAVAMFGSCRIEAWGVQAGVFRSA